MDVLWWWAPQWIAVIDVVDDDPRWPQWFVALEEHYRVALAGLPIVAIEHVGSTSVPGLAAKPVIDVDIVVAAGDVERTIDAMVAVGFVSLGERGIPDRWALGAPAGLPPTNTYVVVDGNVALRNHRIVRDTLRGDASLRDEYATLKRDRDQGRRQRPVRGVVRVGGGDGYRGRRTTTTRRTPRAVGPPADRRRGGCTRCGRAAGRPRR